MDIEHTIKFSNFYCTDCKDYTVINEKNVLICDNCGLEKDAIVDCGAEWHNFNDSTTGTDPSRCGLVQNPLLYESSYGTSIENTYDPIFMKLRQLMQWESIKYSEKSKREVFSKLTNIGTQYKLKHNVIEYAQQLYVEIIEIKNEIDEKSSRGNFLEGLIAACLSKSCDEFKIPIFAKDLAKMFNIDQKNITRGINKFESLILHSTKKKVLVEPETNVYRNYITTYCDLLKMTYYIDLINKYIVIIEKNNLLSSTTHQSIICGCIYFVSVMMKLNVKKEDISKACNISTATINKIYKMLIQYTDILIT